jgi:hypothetical protein
MVIVYRFDGGGGGGGGGGLAVLIPNQEDVRSESLGLSVGIGGPAE